MSFSDGKGAEWSELQRSGLCLKSDDLLYPLSMQIVPHSRLTLYFLSKSERQRCYLTILSRQKFNTPLD